MIDPVVSEIACKGTVYNVLRYIDEKRFGDIGSYFAENSTLTRRGSTTVGRENIIQSLADRPKEKNTRHLCSNFVFALSDKDTATAQCYFTIYSNARTSDDDSAKNIRLKLDIIGEYNIEFSRIEGTWLISAFHVNALSQLA